MDEQSSSRSVCETASKPLTSSSSVPKVPFEQDGQKGSLNDRTSTRSPAALPGEHDLTCSSEVRRAASDIAAEDEDPSGDEIGQGPGSPLMSSKKKKRMSRRPKSQRGIGKPTGFEEYHADPPMTPEQHAEEQELYHQDLLFADRIQTAIQRFERTRKLSPQRRDIFYKYLIYGGVDVGPNMFQGSQDTEGIDKTELAAVLAQTSIADDKRATDPGSKLYDVDFLGCLQAFLSRRAMYCYGFETRAQVELVTTTLERFMDYLLQHDVCPECGTDVLSARDLCRTSASELWACAEAQRWLPGDFNIACSTLFGGSYGRDYDGVTYWGEQKPGEAVFVGMTHEIATQVLRFGIAGAASEDVFQEYVNITHSQGEQQFQVINVQEAAGFEITKIEPPSTECKAMYRENVKDFRPVGRAFARPWKNPDLPPEDLPFEQAASPPVDTEEYIFLVEEIILLNLGIGVKIEATIHQLGCGIWFFDDVIRLYPSFDNFICNELMLGWKEPRAVQAGSDETNGDFV